LPADVLKVSRHGSEQASSAAFLEAVGAEVAIISVGADNPDGDPAQETLERLEAAGARVFRTDQNGTVIVNSDRQNYKVIARPPKVIKYLVFLPWIPLQMPPTATSTPLPPGVPTFTPSPTPSKTSSPTPSPT
jgi:competence protein ComEC